jgi:hypothetical protein
MTGATGATIGKTTGGTGETTGKTGGEAASADVIRKVGPYSLAGCSLRFSSWSASISL